MKCDTVSRSAVRCCFDSFKVEKSLSPTVSWSGANAKARQLGKSSLLIQARSCGSSIGVDTRDFRPGLSETEMVKPTRLLSLFLSLPLCFPSLFLSFTVLLSLPDYFPLSFILFPSPFRLLTLPPSVSFPLSRFFSTP